MQLLYATGYARVPPKQRCVGVRVPGLLLLHDYNSAAHRCPSLGLEEWHDDVREQGRGALCPARKFRAVPNHRTQGSKTRALLPGSAERALGVGRYVASVKRIV